MEVITVGLPEPVLARLRKQAEQAEVSLPKLIADRVTRDFDFALRTDQQAQRRASRHLSAQAGSLLRAGKPAFDDESEQWCVPVLTNVRRGQPTPLGVVRLEASTGALATEERTIQQMADRAAELLGVERFPDDFQARLEELMTRHTEGRLTVEERRELEEMVARMEAQDRENIRRLIDHLRLPREDRVKAEAVLSEERGES